MKILKGCKIRVKNVEIEDLIWIKIITDYIIVKDIDISISGNYYFTSELNKTYKFHFNSKVELM